MNNFRTEKLAYGLLINSNFMACLVQEEEEVAQEVEALQLLEL